MKIYGDLDLNQNRLIKPVIDQGDTFPSNPTTGQIFYLWNDNTHGIDDGLYVYEGPDSGGDQDRKPRDYSGTYNGVPYEVGYEGWVKAGALTEDELDEIIEDLTFQKLLVEKEDDGEDSNISFFRIRDRSDTGSDSTGQGTGDLRFEIVSYNGKVTWNGKDSTSNTNLWIATAGANNNVKFILSGSGEYDVTTADTGKINLQSGSITLYSSGTSSQLYLKIDGNGTDALKIDDTGGIDLNIGSTFQIDGANVQIGGSDIILHDDGGAHDGWVEAKGFIGTDSSATSTLAGNLTVTGDLTVQGTTTTLETQTVTVEDNIMVLNNGESGNGVSSGAAGLQIDRGTGYDEFLMFAETDDRWHVGFDAESGPPQSPAVMAVRVQKEFTASSWVSAGSANLYYIDFVYEEMGYSNSVTSNYSTMLHTTNVIPKVYFKNGSDDYSEVGVEEIKCFFDPSNSNKATCRIYARKNIFTGSLFDGKVVITA